MVRKSPRLATSGMIPLIVVLGLSATVWGGLLISTQHSTAQGSTVSSYTYSDNGLTCSTAADSVSATIGSLVNKVTQDPKFLKTADSSPYVFGNAENITGRSLTTGGVLLGGPTQNGSVVGGTTVKLPNVLEMVFYSYGSDTTCRDTSVLLGTTVSVNAIIVQIPVESGEFNMTGATFSLSAANWG
jgi:hypothetical protein